MLYIIFSMAENRFLSTGYYSVSKRYRKINYYPVIPADEYSNLTAIHQLNETGEKLCIFYLKP